MRTDWSFDVQYAFPVLFTRDVFAADNGVLADLMAPADDLPVARAAVWIDAAVLAAHPGLTRDIHAWFSAHASRRIALAAAPEGVDGGEAAKNGLGLVEGIARTCVELGLCRHSYVIIIGGGAVLDAVGLAASLIHRGLRQIRLPTTTLGQCDAGLGVKNAVNLLGIKNLIGTFTPPWAVVDDARFLVSQDDRTWRAGLAEAVKVAVIKDAGFLDRIEALVPALAARDLAAMEEVVQRSAELHLQHITTAGDPFEHGSSRPLDFGHWSAHRLEVLTHHRLQHGEAVAIGVALDACYAAAIGRLEDRDAERICGVLAGLGFRLWDPCFDLRDADGRRQVYGGLAQFREHLGGRLTLAMPAGLGRRADIDSFDEAVCESALERLRRLQRPVSRGGVPA
ncbi:MAG: 3-dehydroquinate synthase [Planctomycetes bacterium]|nr:3-dehydroquinate synthase [Planctomycetota bacterium]